MKPSIKHTKAGRTMLLAVMVVFLCGSTQSGTAAEPSTDQIKAMVAPPADANVPMLMQAAKVLYESGRYDEAEAMLIEILKKEPSHKSAPYYLDLIKEARFAARARANERSRGLYRIPNVSNQTNLVYTSPGRRKILSTLAHMRLPEVSYDLPLNEALNRLWTESRKQDPDGVGINFMLTGQLRTSDGNTMPAVDMSQITVRINPPLQNLRLADVLDAITKAASVPIIYTIEDYAIVFSPKPPEKVKLYTRVFKVDSKIFSRGLETVEHTKIDKTATADEMLKRYFTAAGADLSDPGKVLFLNDRLGELMVRASLHDLEIIETAIELLNEPPRKQSEKK